VLRATFLFWATDYTDEHGLVLIRVHPCNPWLMLLCAGVRKTFGILRRLLILLLVVWTVVSLVTLLIELVPGDPAVAILGEQATPEQFAQFREKHGLDRPPFFFSFPQDNNGERHFVWHGADNRYTDYWRSLLSGDMGLSFRNDRPVIDLILERYPATIELAIVAMLIAIVIAIPLGVIAGTNRGTIIDNLASVVALLGISLPSFVIGPMLVYIFAVQLRLLSPSGRFDWSDIILPAFTLGAALSAILTRMVRSSVIEELNEDYVRTARAKGLSERTVVYKHVLKNGLIPVVTILGLQLGVLLAGAIITEKIFGWPGLGLLLVEDGIGKRDYRVVQGCVLVISMTYIIANLLTDMVYRWLDPRIRVS
jgi:ABC-type dipeptide/oligopeptide/nickel transport system permease component